LTAAAVRRFIFVFLGVYITNPFYINSYLGFEKNFPPMRLARARKALCKQYRYTLYDVEGNETTRLIMSEAAFIANRLQNDWKPEAWKERPCAKCAALRCGGEESCELGKTVYGVGAGRFSTQITKTGCDFANYLLAEGLTSYEAVEARIEIEKAAREAAEAEAARSEREQADAEKAKRAAEAEYQEWLAEQIRNYGGIGTPQGAKILIQRDIFMDMAGEYPERAKDLLVLIDNLENPHCRRDLMARLHNGNRASIKTFEHVAGVKLAKGYKARMEQLSDMRKADYAPEPKPYKPRKKPEETKFDDVFYKLFRGNDGAPTFQEARGHLWPYKGYDFYIFQADGDYEITEGKSGLRVSRENQLAAAQSAVKKMVNGDYADLYLHTPFDEKIKSAIQKYGVSPLHREAADEQRGKKVENE
jgi:hypothetical protein